jgi:hypothetical protein
VLYGRKCHGSKILVVTRYPATCVRCELYFPVIFYQCIIACKEIALMDRLIDCQCLRRGAYGMWEVCSAGNSRLKLHHPQSPYVCYNGDGTMIFMLNTIFKATVARMRDVGRKQITWLRVEESMSTSTPLNFFPLRFVYRMYQRRCGKEGTTSREVAGQWKSWS